MNGIEGLLVAGGSAAATSSLAVWAIKYWVNKVNKRLDKHEDKLNEIALVLAKQDGSLDKEMALIHREIQTDKHKIIRMESKIEKAWEVLAKIAQPRVSDLLSKELKE